MLARPCEAPGLCAGLGLGSFGLSSGQDDDVSHLAVVCLSLWIHICLGGGDDTHFSGAFRGLQRKDITIKTLYLKGLGEKAWGKQLY